MEKYLNIQPEQATALAGAFSLLINDLQWCNLYQRGYMQLSISADKVQCDWQFIDTILSEEYQLVGQHHAQYLA